MVTETVTDNSYYVKLIIVTLRRNELRDLVKASHSKQSRGWDVDNSNSRMQLAG